MPIYGESGCAIPAFYDLINVAAGVDCSLADLWPIRLFDNARINVRYGYNPSRRLKKKISLLLIGRQRYTELCFFLFHSIGHLLLKTNCITIKQMSSRLELNHFHLTFPLPRYLDCRAIIWASPYLCFEVLFL